MTGADTCVVVSDSLSRTDDIGRAIGSTLQGGEVLALVGELGSGKTHLVKAIATGLGVIDESVVTSPTFTLVQEYAARLHIFHLDAYRLEGTADFRRLGFDEMSTAESVVLVEWADKVQGAMPGETFWISLHRVDETTRRIELSRPSDANSAWPQVQRALSVFCDD